MAISQRRAILSMELTLLSMPVPLLAGSKTSAATKSGKDISANFAWMWRASHNRDSSVETLIEGLGFEALVSASAYGAGLNTETSAGCPEVAGTARKRGSSAGMKKEVRAPNAVGTRSMARSESRHMAKKSMKL